MLGATKTSSLAFLLAVCLPLGVQQAAADILNPSFETGDSSQWSTVGDVSVTDSSFGVDPIDGSYQVLLTTNGATVSETESAMGLSSGTIQSIFDSDVRSSGSGPIEGAAFQQSFNVTEPGDSVTFYYNLLTNESVPEPISTDFLWWNLDGPAGKPRSGVLVHVNETGFSSSGTSYDYETGYESIRIPASQVGTYTLTIGIHDVEDAFRDTATVIDFFILRKTPEPDTFVLLAAGLLGLAFHARRVKGSGGKD
jgi:hypothetical protein